MGSGQNNAAELALSPAAEELLSSLRLTCFRGRVCWRSGTVAFGQCLDHFLVAGVEFDDQPLADDRSISARASGMSMTPCPMGFIGCLGSTIPSLT